MPVPDDQHDQKTCLQIYNPEGFSIEFAMVRNTPQRFDSLLSVVVGCEVLPHHQYRNPNRSRSGLFLA